MRRALILLCLCTLCGCVGKTDEDVVPAVETNVVETIEQVEVSVGDIDTAFGVPCRYVNGEESIGVLMCRKKEVIPEWKVPVDGWQPKERKDGKLEIHQVYDEDGVLLLPEDYGSNTHVIIGLDGEEETECEPCSDGEED